MLRQAFEVLLGEGIPADNIATIKSLLDAIASDDADARYVARVKTHAAFKNIIEKVVVWDDCDTAIHFKNGRVLVFDNDGSRKGGTDSYYAM